MTSKGLIHDAGATTDAPPRARRAFAAALAIAFTATSPARADVLDAYRAFVRTPAALALLADARAAMIEHFDGPDTTRAPATDTVRAWPGPPVGVYATLADGRSTRACVGSDAPLGATLRETVRILGVQALQADRRRAPVRREELDRLRVVVSFAGPATPVADPMTVQPAREGLLVTGTRGSVAFLPGEARTIAYALREARRIGVLADPRDATFARFAVVALSEPFVPHVKTERRTDDEP